MGLSEKITRVLQTMRKQFTVYDMNLALREISFRDSQEYIYSRMGLNTLTFAGSDSVADLRRHCLGILPKKGHIFEFGVYKGESIRFISETLASMGDDRKIYGFDSFSGFSEEWSGVNEEYSKDRFDQGGNRPNVPGNVTLVDGFIEETLPNFISENSIESVAFIHIDTDTYTPAKVVLEQLKPYLRRGSIILFDEFCGYVNWRNHEYRALQELFTESEYEFLGFAHNGPKAHLIKAAIRLI